MPAAQAPKGTLDILPPGDGGAPVDSASFAALVALFAESVRRAGYGLYVGPMFEDVGVYERVGATSDIVGKEMYDFRDKSDRHLALRPDSTPSVVRAFVQHRPTLPWKVWYVAPHFRYDQPQHARYRQHHSVGIEALGVEDADLDAEQITLASSFIAAAGLVDVRLLVNSIGDEVCRPAYREKLIAYLAEREESLCDEHRSRYRENPMRLLDCKRPACVEATAGAPRLLDDLCRPCADHFERVRAGLDAAAMKYEIDTRLVRGQDYYTRTTFEFDGPSIGTALGGGGRYDGFVEAVGGPPTAGIGFGLGVERILLAAAAEGVGIDGAERGIEVFVIDTDGGKVARSLTAELRRAGIGTDRAYDSRSFKAQMKSAMRSGARLALVAEKSGISLRTLQEKGEAEMLDLDSAVEHVRKRLGR